MKVTVFGATGGVGRFVVHHLLADGHEVTAFVRSPGKMGDQQYAVEVVEAELSDTDAVARAVDGADAVITAYGPPIDPFLSDTPLTDGTRTIVKAMHAADVRRLVSLVTVSVPDPRDRPRLLDRLVPIGIGVLIPGALAEVQGIHEAVTTSDLDWTVARMFAPIDVPGGNPIRSGFLGVDPIGVEMARADVARFMVDQLTSTAYLHASPAISN
ncbi:NAD(P)-dependent oxidoreductase [Actinomycetospora corticicola]|uniref:Putative NADH-flavin reductase n=1 Tax=Actinomycetospora corticicola TaxID=663602 RepID=A0A7Y9J7T9_9PSEU|nr:NAD(P)H-binding protein [Actinomycetospora corticicola]NYD38755.1 putative NADH-flavin reductase [Actinomycetospora corticicola]